MAIAVEGSGRRHYLHADPSQVQASIVERPTSGPYVELADNVWDIKVKNYGMTSVSDLFSDRQLLAMTTFSDMVDVVAQQVREDAVIAGWSKDDASAYSDSIALYLAFAVSRQADYCSSLCTWGPDAKNEGITHVFGRQAIPMVWDFAEVNPFSNSSGNFAFMARGITRVLEKLDPEPPGHARQANASTRGYEGFAISTDPPYYDNVGYANLSDYFYAWLRRCVGGRFPEALATVQTPKSDELVADPYRHGDRRSAGQFFEAGFRDVFARMRAASHPGVPVTVFYAFKQADVEGDGLASTGWQTLLEGLLSSGWEVTATWPMRTELGNRLRAASNNSLASSIVLALRPRPGSAETTSRRAFVQALGAELPHALKALQQGSIAPVDMAQAAIGPGMAVFSRYARVLEADGSDMSVRTALALINQALDEVLAKQEGDFDPETRFAVKWFSQYGWNEAPSGEADVLTRAVNTTVSMLERGGIFRAAAGKARLIEPSEMSAGWNPAEDKAISVWEVAVRLGHALLTEGTDQAAAWMRESAARVDLDAVKELSYLMYSVCERKGWAESAMLFNALGTSWGDVSSAARSMPAAVSEQESLTFGDDDDE